MENEEIRIRRSEQRDDLRIAQIVRDCLTEYGYAGRMDSAWGDPFLEHFSEVYIHDDDAYWVAENEDGLVVAGVGIGPMEGVEDVCELQKMYCIKEYRGTGIAQRLLDIALRFAKEHYSSCYLETFENMERARRFYERNGFRHTTETIGCTGHSGCDCHYVLEFLA